MAVAMVMWGTKQAIPWALVFVVMFWLFGLRGWDLWRTALIASAAQTVIAIARFLWVNWNGKKRDARPPKSPGRQRVENVFWTLLLLGGFVLVWVLVHPQS
jgi:hypothetical protein